MQNMPVWVGGLVKSRIFLTFGFAGGGGVCAVAPAALHPQSGFGGGGGG